MERERLFYVFGGGGVSAETFDSLILRSISQMNDAVMRAGLKCAQDIQHSLAEAERCERLAERYRAEAERLNRPLQTKHPSQ